MKRLFIYIAIFGVIFTSCKEDLLDKRPLDIFSESDVWSDASLAQGFIYDIYPDAVGLYGVANTDDLTDNIICNDDNWKRNIQSGAFDNTIDVGWNKFGSIRKCNMAIEKLTNNQFIDERICKHLIAEAKLLRAFIYFWQARYYGGLIIVDKVLTPDDELELPRSTEEATFNFIITDIEEAVVDLPESSALGRLNKGAGYAFLTMVALEAGDYDKVIEAADKVEKMAYELEPRYADLFNNFGTASNSKETILLIQRDEDHNNFIDTRMFRNLMNIQNGDKLHPDAIPQLNDEFQGWPLRWPSQELIDDYLFVENGVAVQKKGAEFEGMMPYKMWENRDLRLDQSIARDSAMFSNTMLTFRRGGNSHWTSNPLSTWGMTKSGYMIRKWFYEELYAFWNYPVNWAEPVLRLGEVYLNKAEAYYRLDNIEKAVEYLNKTRTAHGGLPALATSNSQEFWKFYKIERRVELFNEDDRYWSLLRWAKDDGLSGIPELHGYKLHALDITDGLVKIIESPWAVTMDFEYPKRLYFPVPNNEVIQNPNLEQNTGW